MANSEPELVSEIIEVDDSLEAANDWFLSEKLSDGLVAPSMSTPSFRHW